MARNYKSGYDEVKNSGKELAMQSDGLLFVNPMTTMESMVVD